MDEEKGKLNLNPNMDEARQHFKAARESMHKSWAFMLPPGLVENRKAARNEFLLGLRKLLDVAIEHSDKK